MKPGRRRDFFIAATAVMFIACTSATLAAQGIIFDNTNKAAVQNGPSSATIFRVDNPQIVTYIMTYHYFNYGTPPGSILLIHSDGTIYGPWQASGRTGQAGVANAVWEVFPEVELKPGLYLIIDSDFKTWSQNAESGREGHALVKGRPLGSSAAAPSTLPPGGDPMAAGSSADLLGEWEINGNGYLGTMVIAVQGGPGFSGKLYMERLIDGRVSGSSVSFTRMWEGGGLKQDFVGTLGMDASGRMTMSGTFSQNGGGSYTWTAVRKSASAVQVQVPSLKGVWDMMGNGSPGAMDIAVQAGAAFSGSLYAEKLVDGKISGTTVTFTRSWGSNSLRQDFTGVLGVDGNGRMTMNGIFTQNGAGSYVWSATKRK